MKESLVKGGDEVLIGKRVADEYVWERHVVARVITDMVDEKWFQATGHPTWIRAGHEQSDLGWPDAWKKVR